MPHGSESSRTGRARLCEPIRDARAPPHRIDHEIGRELLRTAPGIVDANATHARRVRIRFRRESGSSIVRRLFGSFDLRSEGDGTRVVHDIHMSAFLADTALMRRRHLADSRAIRARIEAAAP